MASHDDYSHWSNSAKGIRFLMLDGRCAFTIPIFLLHMSVTTAAIMVGSWLVFWLLERNGTDLVAFARTLRLRGGALGAKQIEISTPDRSRTRVDYNRYTADPKDPAATFDGDSR